jgi:hypothetical protein
MKIELDNEAEVAVVREALFEYRDYLDQIEDDSRFAVVEKLLDRIASAEIKAGRARAYRPPSPPSS